MPESQDTTTSLTVPTGEAEHLIRMLKRHLSGSRTCERCGYEGPVGQWGYRTGTVADSDEVLVYACCPSCESPVRLTTVPDGDDSS